MSTGYNSMALRKTFRHQNISFVKHFLEVRQKNSTLCKLSISMSFQAISCYFLFLFLVTSLFIIIFSSNRLNVTLLKGMLHMNRCIFTHNYIYFYSIFIANHQFSTVFGFNYTSISSKVIFIAGNIK